MQLIPEWAPNVHPLVVHFPIALVVAAALADAVALVVRRQAASVAAAGLYGLAAAGAAAAFLTGRQAVDTVEVPPGAIATLTTHEDLALYTTWALGLYALLRVAVAAWGPARRLAIQLLVALLGVGGIVLVWQTAEHGAELVFAHGVGVEQPAAAAGPLARSGDRAAGGAEAAALSTNPEGGWTWHPEPRQALPPEFEVLEGSRSDLHPAGSPDDSLATFHLEGGSIMLVAGEPRTGVQVEAVLDLSEFEGTAALVHHVRDAEHYDFLALDGTEAVQGRRAGDRRTTFDRGAADLSEPLRVRVTAHGTHFYGYLDDRTVAHGHDSAPETGRAGIRLEGSGAVRIGHLAVTPIE